MPLVPGPDFLAKLCSLALSFSVASRKTSNVMERGSAPLNWGFAVSRAAVAGVLAQLAAFWMEYSLGLNWNVSLARLPPAPPADFGQRSCSVAFWSVAPTAGSVTYPALLRRGTRGGRSPASRSPPWGCRR